MERWLIREVKSLTKARLAAVAGDLVASAEARRPRELIVPGRDEHRLLMREAILRAWLWGWMTANEELELARASRFPQFMGSDPPKLEWKGPLPAGAIEWLQRREVMLGKWDRDLDDRATAILVQSLAGGTDKRKLMRGLAEVFPDFSRHRLENVARTETSSALTQGRLARFMAPGSNVVAVQFVAILDARVTDICRSRDGLILRLDDPRLAEHTPPLHFMCRSTLRAIDDWDWEDLQNGDEKALRRLFGHLRGDDAPKDLESALAGWKHAEPPLKGFGSVGAPKPKPKPKPAPAPSPAPTPAKPSPSPAPVASTKPTKTRKTLTPGAKAMKVRKHQKAAKAAVTTEEKLDVALAAGKDVFAHVKKELGADFAILELNLAAKKADHVAALMAEELDLALGGKNIAVLKAEKLTARAEFEEAFEEVASVRQEAVVKALAEWRSFGVDIELAAGSTKAAGNIASDIAERFFPEDWGKAAKVLPQHQREIRTTNATRGFYQHGHPVVVPGTSKAAVKLRKRTRSELALSNRDFDRGGKAAVAAHELQHRWDYINPVLNEVALAYRERRTVGDKVERLRDLYPRDGYAAKEVTKKDKFSHGYVGKLYGPGATEVNTIGVEGMLWNLYDVWDKDPEHLEYILGLFAVL